MALGPKPYLRSVSLRPGALEQAEAQHPFDIAAVRTLGELALHEDVTFFIGENGTGKSTLLEAIAVALRLSPEGGTANFKLETARTVSDLHRELRLVRSYRRPTDYFFLRAESFFNVATFMDGVGYLSSYGGISLHQRSHGEALLTVLTHKLKGRGLYILDEPEAALSPSRQLAALAAIDNLVNAESQFLIATHSPILLAYPRAKILQLDAAGIHETSYEATEHFQVTRDFLNHWPDRIRRLLGDDVD